MDSFRLQFYAWCNELGVDPQRLSDAHSVACFEPEIRHVIDSGCRITDDIPSGARRNVTDAGVFTKGGKGRMVVDVKLFEYLLDTPGLPTYTPGPYIPEVPDSELSSYIPSESTDIPSFEVEDDPIEIIPMPF